MKPATRISVHNSDSLRAALATLADSLSPGVIIETGTHTGMGSTQILLALAQDRDVKRIYTIEISKSLHQQAAANLSQSMPAVECIWGLSVDREEAAEFIKNDPLLREKGPEPDIFIDFLPDPVNGYLNELHGAVGGDHDSSPPNGILQNLIQNHRDDRPLFCLDSAGGIGLLEFSLVQRLMSTRPYGIWLDDINHVKHYRSMLRLQADPNARIIGSDSEEGWLVALCNGVPMRSH